MKTNEKRLLINSDLPRLRVFVASFAPLRN